MKSISSVIRKINRKLYHLLVPPELYVKYYEDGTVWDECVFIESYTGQSFQGNCYYIYKALFNDQKFSNFKFYIGVLDVVGVKKTLKNRNLFDKRVKVVAKGSLEYARALTHCKYLFNNVGFSKDFIKKSKQIYVNTWHGTGPKCCGRRLNTNPDAFNLPQRNFMIADYLVCPNDHSKRLYMDDHMMPNSCVDKLIYCGYPRNTVFFDQTYQKKIRKDEDLDEKVVVFYLPTWRGQEQIKDDLRAIESIDLLAGRLKETHIFYCKLHPNLAQLSVNLKNCRRIPDKYELYELLCCADYLITDWSSVYTDFATKSDRIILYQYDRNYMLTERGLYMDFVYNTPFPVVANITELENKLFSFENCQNYDLFKNLYCPYDSINSTNDITNVVLGKTIRNALRINLIYVTRILEQSVINEMEKTIVNSNCLYVLPEGLDEAIYEYYNKYEKIKYTTYMMNPLLLPVEHRALKHCRIGAPDPLTLLAAKREVRRQWGNIQIDTLYCEELSSVPILLRIAAKNTIVYK